MYIFVVWERAKKKPPPPFHISETPRIKSNPEISLTIFDLKADKTLVKPRKSQDYKESVLLNFKYLNFILSLSEN